MKKKESIDRALLLKNRQNVQDLKLWHQKLLVFLPMDYSLSEAKKGVSWTEPASSEVGCSEPAALLDFLSPFQVVRPRFLSRNTLDQILQVPPET